MPNCKKCNEHFSCRVLINNKWRNLGNRKYCLNCSPFGGRNTRQLHTTNNVYYKTLPTVELQCQKCNKKYQYHHDSTKGHTKTKCNSCLVNLRRFELKKKCVDYKGGSCEKCGYNKCLRVLSFHHLEPTQKDFTISGKHCYSWSKIKIELDKCILVCSNCHGEIHEELETNIRP